MKKIILFKITLILFIGTSFSQSLQSHYFQSEGEKLHYIIKGSGEAVILLHGVLENISVAFGQPVLPDSSSFITKLARKYQVIALDARGHGLSTKPFGKKYYGKNMVEDVVRLMDHLKIEKAHLVGYSMGAIISGNFMIDHPERISSVSLIGGVPLTKVQFKQNPDFGQLNKSIAFSIKSDGGIVPLLKWVWPVNHPAPSDEILHGLSQQYLAGQDLNALQSFFLAFSDLNQLNDKRLARSKVRVQLIIGSNDPFLKYTDFFKGLKGFSQVTMADAGHIDILTRPESLNAVCMFLQQQSDK